MVKAFSERVVEKVFCNCGCADDECDGDAVVSFESERFWWVDKKSVDAK